MVQGNTTRMGEYKGASLDLGYLGKAGCERLTALKGGRSRVMDYASIESSLLTWRDSISHNTRKL